MPEGLTEQNVQWFPIFYPMGPKAFQDSEGVPSGAIGSIAELTKELSNWPIMFLGLRITNVYPLPATPTELDLRVYEACKRGVDDEQTVRVALSQQNITAEATQQLHITGKSGVYWAPFPVPFGMAGGNNIAVTVQRTTPYPEIDNALVKPVCYCTIVAAVARKSEQTIPPMRVYS